jgi:hypothetical protein
MFVIPALTKGIVNCYLFQYFCILVSLVVNLVPVDIYVSYIVISCD